MVMIFNMAHRGASGHEPENTMGAFERAMGLRRMYSFQRMVFLYLSMMKQLKEPQLILVL